MVKEIFLKPNDFILKIHDEAKAAETGKPVSKADLVKLTRTANVTEWNVTSAWLHVIPHKMRLYCGNGEDFIVSGGRFKEWVGNTLIVAPGCLLEFEFDRSSSVFRSGSEIIIKGGSIFEKKCDMVMRDGSVMTLELPNSRNEWNCLVQTPSLISVTKEGQAFCDLLLQPFSDDKRVVMSGHKRLEALDYRDLVALLSYSVIANTRFTS